MPKPEKPRRRTLVTFTREEINELVAEARKRGLRLATYIRSLVMTHQERAGGASTR